LLPISPMSLPKLVATVVLVFAAVAPAVASPPPLN
jgi:hypothetical protein